MPQVEPLSKLWLSLRKSTSILPIFTNELVLPLDDLALRFGAKFQITGGFHDIRRAADQFDRFDLILSRFTFERDILDTPSLGFGAAVPAIGIVLFQLELFL